MPRKFQAGTGAQGSVSKCAQSNADRNWVLNGSYEVFAALCPLVSVIDCFLRLVPPHVVSYVSSRSLSVLCLFGVQLFSQANSSWNLALSLSVGLLFSCASCSLQQLFSAHNSFSSSLFKNRLEAEGEGTRPKNGKATVEKVSCQKLYGWWLSELTRR